MRTVAQTQTVMLKVTKNDLLGGSYIPVQRVSELLKQKEEQDRLAYKAIRNKFYNSVAGGKYNVGNIAGIKCVNAEDTMKNLNASLIISFELGG